MFQGPHSFWHQLFHSPHCGMHQLFQGPHPCAEAEEDPPALNANERLAKAKAALRAHDAKKAPNIEPGLEWRKRNFRTSRSRLALSDLVSHPLCLRELMGTTNSFHPFCPSLNPLKAATSFAQQRHLKCRRCPTAERSLT